MTVRREMPYKEGIYFITFTCYKWLSLIELAEAYDEVYKQFDIQRSEGHYVHGFVIMPNHVHMLLGMKDTGKSINTRTHWINKTFFSIRTGTAITEIQEE